MEITGLSSSILDNYRLSSASTVHSPENFTSMLERAFADKNADEVSSNSGAVSNSAGTQIDKTDKLYQLCLELETFIVKNLINGMRNTVQKSGLVDDSFAGKMYEDMLYDEYAKEFTKGANFGLAEQAYRQLNRLL
jgi:flagellar protein FlgJ